MDKLDDFVRINGVSRGKEVELKSKSFSNEDKFYWKNTEISYRGPTKINV